MVSHCCEEQVHLHNQEDEEGDEQGGLEILVLCRIKSGWCLVSFIICGVRATYVKGIEANSVTRLKDNCLIEILHALVSKPRLRTIWGVTELTAL